MHLRLLIPLICASALAAEPDFPLTADSQPQASVPKGEIIKGSYTVRDGSVFPGTQRDYQIYLPTGLDKTQPAAFMVFQDGVIYQAPVVFDNLIAKKDIPPLVGIFIKPGIVPAANDNALPRFNRSYEYDSITPTYSDFLIDEFLPAIESRHSLKLSTDPNHAAISGNSSGGICAFMVAWHRPDRFRRVFTGVGTYVGIHGADQLPVLVRKFEPKPLRIFLQSGTGDNNLYCGDWWMANQMMERSLTWAGYDVNHSWGEGGHNQKHASQIFPDVLRWLWRDWQTNIEIKANPKGESKWVGGQVVGSGQWSVVYRTSPERGYPSQMTGTADGSVYFASSEDIASIFGDSSIFVIGLEQKVVQLDGKWPLVALAAFPSGLRILTVKERFSELGGLGRTSQGFGTKLITLNTSRLKSTPEEVESTPFLEFPERAGMCCTNDGWTFFGAANAQGIVAVAPDGKHFANGDDGLGGPISLSPDQSTMFRLGTQGRGGAFSVFSVSKKLAQPVNPSALSNGQPFHLLQSQMDNGPETQGDALCVDTNGWLYVATSLGIQVLDQAGRVNFIIPTPQPPHDVCFGGRDLSELFIACGDTIYKRPTKAKGVVSGQQPPIKPPAPKL